MGNSPHWTNASGLKLNIFQVEASFSLLEIGISTIENFFIFSSPYHNYYYFFIDYFIIKYLILFFIFAKNDCFGISNNF